MEPKSLSASALHAFEMCPARYNAEYIERSRGFGGTAASLGTTVHGALENWVKACYIEKTQDPDLKLLQDYYHLSYIDTFKTHNTDSDEYLTGLEMLSTWFARPERVEYFNAVHRIISCEVKTFFPVPTSIGEIPFNYIWDRFDEMKPGVFKVVDYKSSVWDVQPSDLQKKIQPRAYALAAAIQLKAQGIHYDRIWVEFDMLRYGARGRVFTREDNAATWKYLKSSAEDIIATPGDEAEERLNPECRFCVRKAGCTALRKNIMVGGVHSIGSIEGMIDLRAQLEFQSKGLDALIKEVDNSILTEAKARDLEQYESDLTKLTIGISKRRAVDADMVEKAIGPELFQRYGSHNITLANVDKLLKGNELTKEQKAQLRGLIYDKKGEPRVRVDLKNPIDE